MKRLLNLSEERAKAELDAVASRHGLGVHAKVRVADVLPIEGSGVTSDLYRYALMAHFDFVVTDLDFDPRFAVEFDGPGHAAPRAKALDAKKDALCQAFGLSLLRIRSSHLPKAYSDLSLLEWIVDVYHLQRAFDDAQAGGSVPYDESFDPFFIVADSMEALSDPKARRFPYWISREAALSIQRLHKQGKVAQRSTSGLIGLDKEGNRRGIEYIRVNATHGILVSSGMRAQLFPVPLTDLLRELLLISVHDKLQRYLATGSGLTPIETIRRLHALYDARLAMLCCHSSSGPLK